VLAREIEHAADRVSDRVIEPAGYPGGEGNRSRRENDGDRRAAADGDYHDRGGKA
jgi:hypothetical protein